MREDLAGANGRKAIPEHMRKVENLADLASMKQRNYRHIAQAYSSRSQMRRTTSKTARSNHSNVTAPLHCPVPIPQGIGRGKQQGKSHTAIALCPCTLGAPSGNLGSRLILCQVPRRSSYYPSVGRCGSHHSVLPKLSRRLFSNRCQPACRSRQWLISGRLPHWLSQHPPSP